MKRKSYNQFTIQIENHSTAQPKCVDRTKRSEQELWMYIVQSSNVANSSVSLRIISIHKYSHTHAFIRKMFD